LQETIQWELSQPITNNKNIFKYQSNYASCQGVLNGGSADENITPTKTYCSIAKLAQLSIDGLVELSRIRWVT